MSLSEEDSRILRNMALAKACFGSAIKIMLKEEWQDEICSHLKKESQKGLMFVLK